MFWIIARHQIRLLFRDRVAWIAMGVLIVGMAYAFGSGYWQLRRERAAQIAFLSRSHEVIIRNQQVAVAIERRIAAGQEPERVPPPFGTRHPAYVAAWSRQPALLPPSPLEWLAFGQSDLYPTAYAGPEHDEVSQIGNPLALFVGRWDLSTAIIYLLPLVILALGFDLTASERENGMWSLTVSQPVRGSTVLLAKWAAVSGIVLASVSAMFIVAVVLVAWNLDFGMILRVSVAALATLVYGGFWLALVLAVNAMKTLRCADCRALRRRMAGVSSIPAVHDRSNCNSPLPSRAPTQCWLESTGPHRIRRVEYGGSNSSQRS